VFDLRDVFQERNPGVKLDLPVTNPKEHSPYSEANRPGVASTHASLAAVSYATQKTTMLFTKQNNISNFFLNLRTLIYVHLTKTG
jgi:hypothetical protein